MSSPHLWIIAGPNGAGKTTFVQQTQSDFGLPADAYINADAITLDALIESVLSTENYRALVERVRELGGALRLIYLALNSSELSKQRVRLRVSRGGHGVPEDKLDSRWHRSLQILPWFAFYASEFWFIDNSELRKSLDGMMLVTGDNHVLRLHGIPPPEIRPIVSKFLSTFIGLNADGRWHLDLNERYILPDDWQP